MIDEIVRRAIVVLWRSREFDTRDIAEVVVEPEATVDLVLNEARGAQRDFVEVVGVNPLSAPAPHPDPLPSGERGEVGA